MVSNKQKKSTVEVDPPAGPEQQTKQKVFIVMQHDMVTKQNVRAGVFDSEQKAKDYCSGLEVKDNNYVVEEAEVE